MKVICDHAGTEHCKEIHHGYFIKCPCSKPHDENKECNGVHEIIKVKCIPYQEDRK